MSVGTCFAKHQTEVLRTNRRKATLTPAVLHNHIHSGGGCDGRGASSHQNSVFTNPHWQKKYEKRKRTREKFVRSDRGKIKATIRDDTCQ